MTWASCPMPGAPGVEHFAGTGRLAVGSSGTGVLSGVEHPINRTRFPRAAHTATGGCRTATRLTTSRRPVARSRTGDRAALRLLGSLTAAFGAASNLLTPFIGERQSGLDALPRNVSEELPDTPNRGSRKAAQKLKVYCVHLVSVIVFLWCF